MFWWKTQHDHGKLRFTVPPPSPLAHEPYSCASQEWSVSNLSLHKEKSELTVNLAQGDSKLQAPKLVT